MHAACDVTGLAASMTLRVGAQQPAAISVTAAHSVGQKDARRLAGFGANSCVLESRVRDADTARGKKRRVAVQKMRLLKVAPVVDERVTAIAAAGKGKS